MKHILLTVTLGMLLVGCGRGKQVEKPEQASPATVYVGGRIITMAGGEAGAYDPSEKPGYVEAVVVRDGKIAFVGPRDQATGVAGDGATLVDLAGRTMLPGFIDAHGHISGVGLQAASANLLPPPDGSGENIDNLITVTRAWVDQNASFIAQTKGWIIGFGYDDSQLEKQKHPKRGDLDEVSRDNPVVFIHQSSPMGVVNGAGLVALEITTCGKVQGGVVECEDDGLTPNGVLKEAPFFLALRTIMSGLDQDSKDSLILKGMELYASYGYTTAQDGRSSPQDVSTFIGLASSNQLIMDIAAYPDIESHEAAIGAHQDWLGREYTNRFRIAGAKISLDGSPQGKTAWLTEPYEEPPPDQDGDTPYYGFAAYEDDQVVDDFVALAFQNGWQLLAHCNGDAAADQLLRSVEKASAPRSHEDRRTVMIHAQTVRDEQLDEMKALGIIPSFFSMHTYYWGDWHRTSVLGEDRASHISPTRWALDRGMIFTEHHDAPVAFPDSLRILDATVNRVTRNPRNAPYVLGPDQRVSRYVAMLSITRWAAYQYFEEAHKGTIETGKLADLVILSGDPFGRDTVDIMGLEILATIKEGKTIYSKIEPRLGE